MLLRHTSVGFVPAIAMLITKIEAIALARKVIMACILSTSGNFPKVLLQFN